MESLFSRLFKYRSSDKRVQQENFLTEIFAFLLENVPDLLTTFLNECNVVVQSQPENITIEPQLSFSTYPERIQPDISIRFFADKQRWLVFIENKVGAVEGKDQLEKYSDYLEKEASKGTNCVLLYITRFYDPKDTPSTELLFGQKKWWQIYELLDKFKDNAFVFEARLFMDENGLSMSRNFSADHITAMMQWNIVREMMDESLRDVVEKRFEEVTGLGYSTAWIDKNLRSDGDYFQAAGSLFWVQIGYFLTNSDDKNYPSVDGAIVVEPPYSNRLQAIQALREFVGKNNAWEPFGDFDNEAETVWITRGQSLKEIISKNDHMTAIQELFLEILSDIETFQKDNLHLPWD